jgi:hypothetical protein
MIPQPAVCVKVSLLQHVRAVPSAAASVRPGRGPGRARTRDTSRMTPWSERHDAPADADGIVRLVRVAAYAVCREGERLLCCRLAPGEPSPGSWTLPGGGIDFGERPETPSCASCRRRPPVGRVQGSPPSARASSRAGCRRTAEMRRSRCSTGRRSMWARCGRAPRTTDRAAWPRATSWQPSVVSMMNGAKSPSTAIERRPEREPASGASSQRLPVVRPSLPRPQRPARPQRVAPHLQRDRPPASSCSSSPYQRRARPVDRGRGSGGAPCRRRGHKPVARHDRLVGRGGRLVEAAHGLARGRRPRDHQRRAAM